MELNKNDKTKLRNEVLQKLESVDEGQRIHIDKDMLEYLLFDEVIEYQYNGGITPTIKGKGKIVSWSGDFLQKIDLSEVSFEDVMWRNYGFLTKPGEIGQPTIYDEVHLENTNVNIDFSMSYEAKHPTDYYGNDLPVGTKNSVILSNINLSGVDLSNSNFDFVGGIKDCNIDYTNAPIVLEEPAKEMKYLRIEGSSLEGIDLSKYTVNAVNLCPELVDIGIIYLEEDIDDYKEDPGEFETELFLYENGIHPKRIQISNCNLKNTGLNIIFDETDKFLEENSSLRIGEILGYYIKNGQLIGCNVNNKKIKSPEESGILAQEKLQEYEAYKEDIFKSLLEDIDNQTSNRKK